MGRHPGVLHARLRHRRHDSYSGLGSYTSAVLDETVTGNSQELLSGLYIARRGFWGDKTVKYPEALDALWAELTEGAAP